MRSFLMLSRAIFITGSLLIAQIASASVWDSGNNYWNGNWEIKYQNWVTENWKPDFFMSPAKPEYDQIPHDCADAIYLMRATFAYENKLPFKIHYLDKKGKYIENTMTTWDKLPQNQRFRAFAEFMNDRVGTRSFAKDSFPIALAHSVEVTVLSIPPLNPTTTPST